MMKGTMTPPSSQVDKGRARAALLAAGAATLLGTSGIAGQAYGADVTAGVEAGSAQVEPRQAIARREIIVSLADRKLALIEDGRVVKVYPVAVGTRRTPSPAGQYEVRNRVTTPTYYRKGVVVPPGSANPVGTRWIGLTRKGYGIHGTNEPKSIGRAVTHGCIRMRQADVEELFELVRAGDMVEIKAESQIAAWTPAFPAPAAVVANSPEPPTSDSAQSGARSSAAVMAGMAGE